MDFLKLTHAMNFFAQGVKLSNLTAMEVNIIRPFMSSALDHLLDATGALGT